MSEPNDDPDDTPFQHRVLYTNDVTRILSTFISGLLTIAEPSRVLAALQRAVADWPRHVEMHEQVKRVAEQHEAFQKQQREARERAKGSGN